MHFFFFFFSDSKPDKVLADNSCAFDLAFKRRQNFDYWSERSFVKIPTSNHNNGEKVHDNSRCVEKNLSKIGIPVIIISECVCLYRYK